MTEELDIPIWSTSEQMEKGYCMECGKRKAKWQCDYITGKSIDLYGKGVMKQSTCDKYLCDECTYKINYRDYCKEHYKMIKEEI